MNTQKLHHRAKRREGEKYGMLTAIRPDRRSNGTRYWLFQCECGNQTVKSGKCVERAVRNGQTPSCGCLTKKIMSAQRSTHGMSRTPVYAVYRSMIDRCRLPTHQAWHNYGARGIRVCESWSQSFENFWGDMEPTYQPGLTLDRIDNNGDYEPRNCRWVTPKVQSRNRRGNVPFCVATIQDTFGISRSTIYYRWRRQLSVNSAEPDPGRKTWQPFIE